MDEQKWLGECFEENRGHLRAVAYRMLGSLSEADDAVQEAWLKLSHSGAEGIDNLGGWLTTVVARVCLDILRSRASRREEPLSPEAAEPAAVRNRANDPEEEALLADSVGLALLVVLDRLTPAERLAFVMHDMFAMPFEEIAPVVGRSTGATRQLASRARRRVNGAGSTGSGDLSRRRTIVDGFLKALRAGDLEGLLALLDPEVVVRIDGAAAATGAPVEIRGARAWARQAIAFSQAVRFAQAALVDGEVGFILAPRGRLLRALRLTLAGDQITRIDIVGEPERLRELEVATLPSSM